MAIAVLARTIFNKTETENYKIMSNEITISEQTKTAELSVFNAELFGQFMSIAKVLAQTSLIPDSLKQGKNKELLPVEQIEANCFLVVEQSHRWGMSPFAAVGAASVVYGRLMWEGKLISAIIKAKLGIDLKYDFNDATGDELECTVSGTLAGESEPRTLKGAVGQWKTTGAGSPWSNPLDHQRQCRYRGAREWARAYAPGVILGVVTVDEAVDFEAMKHAKPAPKPAIKIKEGSPFEQPKIEEKPTHDAVKTNDSGLYEIQSVGVEDVPLRNGGKCKIWSVVLLNSDGSNIAKTSNAETGQLAEMLDGQLVHASTKYTDKGLALVSIKPASNDEII